MRYKKVTNLSKDHLKILISKLVSKLWGELVRSLLGILQQTCLKTNGAMAEDISIASWKKRKGR